MSKHDQLVRQFAKILRQADFAVGTEITVYGPRERVDIFALAPPNAAGRQGPSVLVECKTSLVDFHREPFKSCAQIENETGEDVRVGDLRYILAPPGMLSLEYLWSSLPGYGLIELHDDDVRVQESWIHGKRESRERQALQTLERLHEKVGMCINVEGRRMSRYGSAKYWYERCDEDEDKSDPQDVEEASKRRREALCIRRDGKLVYATLPKLTEYLCAAGLMRKPAAGES